MAKGSDRAPAVDANAPTETEGSSGGKPTPSELRPGAPEIAEGERLGKFTIGQRIGAGGMGVVHEARDETLQRRVALKLLRLDAQADAPRAERLLREARAAAGV